MKNLKFLTIIIVVFILAFVGICLFSKNNNVDDVIVNNTESNKIENIKTDEDNSSLSNDLSNSKAPEGEIVFKNFNISNNEEEIQFSSWESLDNIFYKKITTYSEYKKLMDNYSDLRTLTETDFDNYFAVVIVSEERSLNYKYITYENDILNINIDSNKENNRDFKYKGLVIIISNEKNEYSIGVNLNNIDTLSKKRTPENVTIEVLQDTITKESAEILITDNNEQSYGWGDNFRLQKKENGTWKEMQTEDGILTFNSIAYNLNEDKQVKLKTQYGNYYGTLENGIYRIVKPVYDNGYIDLYSNEFEVK